MEERRVTALELRRFAGQLRREERSPGTVEKYLGVARSFGAWLGCRPVTKELVSEWKEELRRRGTPRPQ